MSAADFSGCFSRRCSFACSNRHSARRNCTSTAASRSAKRFENSRTSPFEPRNTVPVTESDLGDGVPGSVLRST